MALTMLDKTSDRADKSAWPPAIAAEFERERAEQQSAASARSSLSENERTRVWIIRLAPGERIGFHRHVLDYFWTCVTGGRGRQHVTTARRSNTPMRPARPATRLTAAGEFKVHDLENIGDKEMVFMTVEFLNSANKPLALPATGCAPRHRAQLPILWLRHAGRARSAEPGTTLCFKARCRAGE